MHPTLEAHVKDIPYQNVLDSIKWSISSTPNGRIQRLRISVMEFKPIKWIIPSADNHINDRLAVQLYRNSNPPNSAPWDSRRNTFTNQLPQSLVLNDIDS